MPLDGARGRYRQLLDHFAQDESNEVIHISFDDSYKASGTQPHEEHVGPAGEALVDTNIFDQIEEFYLEGYSENIEEDLAELKDAVIKDNRKPTAFEIARGVKTSYNISLEEQAFLLAAAKYIVHQKANEIFAALGPSPRASAGY